MWLGVARNGGNTLSVRIGRCCYSFRMGDHPGFLAINPCQAYKMCSIHNRHFSLQTKTANGPSFRALLNIKKI